MRTQSSILPETPISYTDKILLVDVDSTIPNVALMKLSTFFKGRGDEISLLRLKISYYPNRKHKQSVDAHGFDKIFVSTIFQGNNQFVKIKVSNKNRIKYGGTGHSLKENLPNHIEELPCDYTLYPENDTSYGFITRGCPRKCPFCWVPQKEGGIHQVSTVDNIIKHKKVKFLDNNILAWKQHKEILQELVDKGKKIKCQFNQGLDMRLINDENAQLLSKINYLGEYIFAFDDIRYETIINAKLKILKKYINKDWKMKFFIYCHPKMDIKNDVYHRILWCKENKVLPYLMRDISCWESKNNKVYVDLAAWCNQPGLFKKMDFNTFLTKRHPSNKNRVNTVSEAVGGTERVPLRLVV